MIVHKKKIAYRLFPRYSKIIDEINNNAKVGTWIRDHTTTLVFPTKPGLYRHVNQAVCGSGPIDYLEFGVYRGDSMRTWTGINTDPNSRFLGFDSFEGLPETWNKKNRTGTFDLGGQMPIIDDTRVKLIKGWFQQTLRPELTRFVPRSRLVIHNDSDLHSSTLFVLTVLDPLIVPGTVLIFDEFSSPLHEFRAFHDYVNAYKRSIEVVGTTTDYASQVAFIFTN
jgi:O-methyltransferase